METWHIRAAEGLENRVYLRVGGQKKIKGSLLVLGREGAEGEETQRDRETLEQYTCWPGEVHFNLTGPQIKVWL